MRTRDVFQFEKLTSDLLVDLFRKSVQLLFRRTTKDDRISHDTLFGFAGSKVFAQRSPGSGPTLLDSGDVEQVLAELPVLQQTFDHRPALTFFKCAKGGVHSIC